ncbi:MAG TPA: tetratricopeptide repeat protein [Terriglobales bacterium]|nr:tetratricopeptide repeat protein [Terriglobales bacterium]
MVSNRREHLQEFVRLHPDQPFARYGLAMDFANAGESVEALEQFTTLQRNHPDYTAAYQQAGQLLIRLQRWDEARTVLRRGLECATRVGDLHAGQEMQGLLEEAEAEN